jgi:hypothetical protein
MGNTINVMELARAIAEIASQTRDPDTAVQLVEVVDRLLTKAGLPAASTGQSQDQLGRQ